MSLRSVQQNEKQFQWRHTNNSWRPSQHLTTTQQTIASEHIRNVGPINIIIKRCTPVLFSTNRGLHLRVAKSAAEMTATGSSRMSYSSSGYDIQFCDLERWSTKANAVCLEDSFTNSHYPEFQKHSERGSRGNLNCTFTRFNCR